MFCNLFKAFFFLKFIYIVDFLISKGQKERKFLYLLQVSFFISSLIFFKLKKKMLFQYFDLPHQQ